MKKRIQKLIALFIFALLFVAHSAFASITFDPVSPQNTGVNVIPTCTIGDSLEIYYSDGSNALVQACDGVTAFSSPPIAVDTLSVVECDSSVLLSSCTGDGTLSLAVTDTGYISQENYTFTAVEEGGGGSSETGLIHFETYQALSFVLTGGIFIYLTVSLVAFIINKGKSKKRNKVFVTNLKK